MNKDVIINLFLLFGATLDFTIAFIVFLKNRKETGYSFAVACTWLGLWTLGIAIFRIVEDIKIAYFWNQEFIFTAGMIPLSFIHFIHTLINRPLSLKKKIFLYAHAIPILIGVIVPGALIKDIVIRDWGKESILGYAYPIYGTYFTVYMGYGFLQLIREYIKAKGLYKLRLKYILFSTLPSTLIGAFFNLYLILLGNYKYIWVGPYCSFVFASGVSYAILKHRLMGIELASRYLAVYISYVLVNVLIFLPFIFLFKFPPILLLLLCALSSPYIHQLVDKFLRPTIFSKYSYWEKLKSFFDNKVFLTSGQLAEAVKEVYDLIGIDSFSLFLYSRDRDVYVPYEYEGLEGVFDEEQAEFLNVIYSDDPLVLYLKEKQEIVMKEEIENKDVISQLEGLKATISIPLFTSGELVGILNLGEKKTKESYYEEDIRILKEFKRFLELHLSHTVFLENSLFYSSGVAHDLRKPFKNGYIYDLVEELSEKEGEERQEIKEELIEKLSRFHNMLNTMLNISDVMKRVINGSFKPKRIKYIELINDITKSHEKELKDKGLELILDLPKSCDVYAEEDSVRRVVDELITNAIKYTDKGSITIKVSKDKKEVITDVIDTGCGIEEGKQADIWGLFKRAVDSNTKEGYGIGLAVARNLAEINNGRLFLKYSTPNKGSCFCFVLPKK